ncbi:MAG: hypothetical protein L0H31_03755 [Nocardioidaceae bacterium]|uniref:hypothetical protein n=1 Tax=Corynebacterium sp. TaxID=1720 RepID=UPI00264779EC|nr:hypothetical protein [Corynebacterium sp.]MDN5722027.1 hypothetical protein [Corynebacterium sp.]MDN5744220.1 hypothetical protein [Nocardioidaceae bacterium]
MRGLVIATFSLLVGLVLWYLVSCALFLAVEVPDMGVSRAEYIPESLGDVAGLAYSSIFMVLWSTGEHGVIGIPVCIGVAACGVVALTAILRRRDTNPMRPRARTAQ